MYAHLVVSWPLAFSAAAHFRLLQAAFGKIVVIGKEGLLLLSAARRIPR
jgi:hypothetical protein